MSFLPKLLFNEFKFFFNMFFLVIALSQFVPFLKVGLLVTYVAPLVFVLVVTMIKEAYDDIQRFQRDKDLNHTKYDRLSPNPKFNNGNEREPIETINAKDIRVGHILKVKPN